MSDDIDREREGYQRQAHTFRQYAQQAETQEVHDLWRHASQEMEMAASCNAPEGMAKHRSNAARFARHAQHAEKNPTSSKPPQPDLQEEERQRKATQKVVNDKRERTRYERLRKKFEGH